MNSNGSKHAENNYDSNLGWAGPNPHLLLVEIVSTKTGIQKTTHCTKTSREAMYIITE